MDAVIIQVVLFSTVGACVYMFRSLRRRVKQKRCSKAKAVLWYAGASLVPSIFFLLLFFATVGLEELTGEAWISDVFARSLIPVAAIATGLALLANLAFVVTLAMMKTGPRP
jgi:protein-S-isoprenylcysteine O-methyltransferase Ste14